MEHEHLERLWNAAQGHSVVMGGEFLDPDWDGEESPPMPEDPADVIREVADYLERTV